MGSEDDSELDEEEEEEEVGLNYLKLTFSFAKQPLWNFSPFSSEN